MKFSEMTGLILISIVRENVRASEQAPLLLLFYDIPEDGYYYSSKHVGKAITHVLKDKCEIS